MIQELPPGPESGAIIRDDANGYAQSVIDDDSWLGSLSPEEATSALLMIIAHANQDLLDQALSNICIYMDGMEDQWQKIKN